VILPRLSTSRPSSRAPAPVVQAGKEEFRLLLVAQHAADHRDRRGPGHQGLGHGLVGQTVGSRVLLVIPPAGGYGSAGASKARISGTDTLVFVVDILAAV